jgi:hypothetical protein
MLITFFKSSVASAFAFFVLSVASLDAEISLNLPASGDYHEPVKVLTPSSFGGASFDIVYTIRASAKNMSPYVSSVLGNVGVGSEGEVVDHARTLDGDSEDGLAFTNLTIQNFNANSSGLTVSDIADNIGFSSILIGNAGNAQDGIDVSFEYHGVEVQNVPLNRVEAQHELELASLEKYSEPAQNFYLMSDNLNVRNRINVVGIKVDIPEPGTTVVVGLLVFVATFFCRKHR